MKQFKTLFKTKRFTLVLLYLLLATTTGVAQASMEPLVEQGNAAYNEGDFQKAISLYEQTLKMGQHSAALYFNLGNSYYRLNKVAESIYYFEKAKLLNPKDEDIQVNSAFAQNMTIDAIENLPESQIAQFQKSLFGVFSFFTWSVLTVLLLWVFVGFFLGYLFFKSTQLKRSFFFSAMLVLVVFIISFFVTFTIDKQDKNTQYAILFSDQIDIWSEPNLQGDLLFTLHEGTKVQLLDKLEEWQKIRIANGSEGWIRNASLRKLESAITK